MTSVFTVLVVIGRGSHTQRNLRARRLPGNSLREGLQRCSWFDPKFLVEADRDTGAIAAGAHLGLTVQGEDILTGGVIGS